MYLKCDKYEKEYDEFAIPKTKYIPGSSIFDIIQYCSQFFGYLLNEINIKEIKNNKDCR